MAASRLEERWRARNKQLLAGLSATQAGRLFAASIQLQQEPRHTGAWCVVIDMMCRRGELENAVAALRRAHGHTGHAVFAGLCSYFPGGGGGGRGDPPQRRFRESARADSLRQIRLAVSRLAGRARPVRRPSEAAVMAVLGARSNDDADNDGAQSDAGDAGKSPSRRGESANSRRGPGGSNDGDDRNDANGSGDDDDDDYDGPAPYPVPLSYAYEEQLAAGAGDAGIPALSGADTPDGRYADDDGADNYANDGGGYTARLGESASSPAVRRQQPRQLRPAVSAYGPDMYAVPGGDGDDDDDEYDGGDGYQHDGDGAGEAGRGPALFPSASAPAFRLDAAGPLPRRGLAHSHSHSAARHGGRADYDDAEERGLGASASAASMRSAASAAPGLESLYDARSSVFPLGLGGAASASTAQLIAHGASTATASLAGLSASASAASARPASSSSRAAGPPPPRLAPGERLLTATVSSCEMQYGGTTLTRLNSSGSTAAYAEEDDAPTSAAPAVLWNVRYEGFLLGDDARVLQGHVRYTLRRPRSADGDGDDDDDDEWLSDDEGDAVDELGRRRRHRGGRRLRDVNVHDMSELAALPAGEYEVAASGVRVRGGDGHASAHGGDEDPAADEDGDAAAHDGTRHGVRFPRGRYRLFLVAGRLRIRPAPLIATVEDVAMTYGEGRPADADEAARIAAATAAVSLSPSAARDAAKAARRGGALPVLFRARYDGFVRGDHERYLRAHGSGGDGDGDYSDGGFGDGGDDDVGLYDEYTGGYGEARAPSALSTSSAASSDAGAAVVRQLRPRFFTDASPWSDAGDYDVLTTGGVAELRETLEATGASDEAVARAARFLRNYAVETRPGRLSILPRRLTVTALRCDVVYGDPIHGAGALRVSFAGWARGDGPERLAGRLRFHTLARSSAPAASRTLARAQAEDASSSQLLLLSSEGADADGQLVARGADAEPEHQGPPPAAASSGVGEYAVTPYGLSSPNYDIVFVSSHLRIVPRRLLVRVKPVYLRVGERVPSNFGVEIAGWAAGDSWRNIRARLSFMCARESGAVATAADIGSFEVFPSLVYDDDDDAASVDERGAERRLVDDNYEFIMQSGPLHVVSQEWTPADDIAIVERGKWVQPPLPGDDAGGGGDGGGEKDELVVYDEKTNTTYYYERIEEEAERRVGAASVALDAEDALMRAAGSTGPVSRLSRGGLAVPGYAPRAADLVPPVPAASTTAVIERYGGALDDGRSRRRGADEGEPGPAGAARPADRRREDDAAILQLIAASMAEREALR